MYHVQFSSTWSRALWIQFVLVHLDKYSALTTLCSGRVVLETIGRKAITQVMIALVCFEGISCILVRAQFCSQQNFFCNFNVLYSSYFNK